MVERWVVSDPEALGRAIRSFRDAQELTQAELAAQAGLHRSYLSDLERGRATEQTQRLFRVLRRLGLELEVRPRGSG
jgi:HTH-type transcriptional regulator/antitoxin HipB